MPTKSARKMRIRSHALELLDAAGYIPKPRLQQAMRIASRCENQKPPNVPSSATAINQVSRKPLQLTKAAVPGSLKRGVVPRAWRIHRAHDLWVEIREGYGKSNRMIADCLSPTDAEHIVNMHNVLENGAPKHHYQIGRWEAEIRADAIRSAAKLPPFESGRFVQVQDIIRLADEVENGEE